MVRPLLNVRRIELQQFLQDRGVAWIEDPANTSDSHARSWIRTEIVPLLIQRWPSVVENVDRVAGQLAEMLETVDDTACKEILSHARPLRRTLFCRAEPLFLPPLMSGSEGFFYIALRRWLHQGGVGSPGRKQLKELYRQLSNVGSAHHCRLYLGELEVIYFDQHLFLVEERQFSIPDGLKACADQNMICDRLNVTYTHSGEGFHKDVFQSHNVYWRMRRSNDRFTLSDKSGSMNLKKAMQQTKQVPWLRHSLPVLAQEHDIIWAHGLGVNTRFRVGGDQDRDGVLPMFKIT